MKITIDRAWAEQLGITQSRGVTRSGNFYQIPRALYHSLIPADSPCFDPASA